MARRLAPLSLALALLSPLAAPLRAEAQGASALYAAAQSAFGQGLYASAAEGLRTLLRDYPSDPLADDAEYLLALARVYSGSYDQAARSLEQFPRRYPGSPFLRFTSYWLGFARYSLGQAAEAVAAFRAQIDAHPAETRYRQYSLSYLAELYDRSGDAGAALLASRELLQSGAGGELEATALYRIGAILLERGELGEAGAAFSRIRLEHPSSPLAVRAEYSEAESLRRRGEATEAMRRYQGFLDDAGGDPALASLVESARMELASLARATGDGRAVIAQTRRLLEDFPSSSRRVEALLLQAEALFDARDYAAARAAWSRALESIRDPAERQRVSFNLAACAAAAGDTKAALESLDAAAAGPEATVAARSRYRQAVLHASSGAPQKAIPILQGLVAAGGAEEEVLRFAAGLLDGASRFRESRALWTELLSRFPGSSDAARYLYRRGAASLELGDHAAALDDFVALIRTYGERAGAAALVAEARYNVGYVYAARGEHVRAMPYYERAREAASDPALRARCLLALGVAQYNVEDFPAALRSFRQYLAEAGDDASRGRGLLALGKAELRSGAVEAAAATLQKAAGALEAAEGGAEDGAEALAWLGNALTMLGRTDAARQSWLDLAERYPASSRVPEAWLRAGTASRLLGDLDQARELLARAVSRLPAGDRSGPREEALYELGLAALAQGRPAEARRSFAQVAREYPSSSLAPEGSFKIAQASFEAGRFRDAASEFQEVARLYPGSEAAAPAAFWAGESARRAGDEERAAAGYWDYLKRAPSGSYARAAEEGIAALVSGTRDPGFARRLYEAAEADSAVPPALVARVRLEYASLLLERGSVKEAEAVSRRVEPEELQEPYRGQAHLLAARLARKRGARDQAATILGALAGSRADRVGAEALLELGETLAESGKSREAASELLRLTVLYAQEKDLVPRALSGAVLALKKAGDVDGASRIEKRLADEFPGWKPPR